MQLLRGEMPKRCTNTIFHENQFTVNWYLSQLITVMKEELIRQMDIKNIIYLTRLNEQLQYFVPYKRENDF